MIESAKRVLSLGAVALLAACTSSSSQIDVAGSRETAAFYIQVGSAWMRP